MYPIYPTIVWHEWKKLPKHVSMIEWYVAEYIRMNHLTK